jgi:hypothetical protein
VLIKTAVPWVAGLLLAGACAPLATLPATVLPPSFQIAEERPTELRLLGPTPARPLGGASVRIYARVGNPNPFGVTLTGLDGTLFLEEQQAALFDFPLGVPLPARQDTIVPIDLTVRFADVPPVASALVLAIDRSAARFRLDGNVRVNAGLLGQPMFGPLMLLEGTIPIIR